MTITEALGFVQALSTAFSETSGLLLTHIQKCNLTLSPLRLRIRHFPFFYIFLYNGTFKKPILLYMIDPSVASKQ